MTVSRIRIVPPLRAARANMATAAIINTSHADGSAEKAFLGKPKDKVHEPRGKKRKLQGPPRSEGLHDEVLSADVRTLLAKLNLSALDSTTKPLERFEEIEVIIDEISSTGDGLGHVSGHDRIFLVPFTAPGDVVKAKFVREDKTTNTMICDFIKVITPSSNRYNDLIKCPYFSSCSGCQFQMLPYSNQLAHKRTIVEKAFRNFSGLPASVIPAIGDTMGSPLQYGYRTKLTPHFDGPPGGRRASRKGDRPKFEEVPPIGFMLKGTRKTLDIEECPIGTESVQMGLRRERKRVSKEIDKYTKGATILLRESTERKRKDEFAGAVLGLDEEHQVVHEDRGEYVHAKTCVTNNNATTTEYVDDFVFENNANSFFQNNNSILPSFTEYIRSQIIAQSSSSTTNTSQPLQLKNLIDAYSGSGLFTITLSNMFARSVGIDIDMLGINYARRNARLNNLLPVDAPESSTDATTTTDTTASNTNTNSQPTSSSLSDSLTTTTKTPPPSSTTPRVNFIAATASELFSSVSSWNSDETCLICDPPRKGCDESFLRQVLAFRPAKIVYVSCNVHTQARDVGFLLRNGEGPGLGEGVGGVAKDGGKGEDGDDKVVEGWQKAQYVIETLRGFDFFPQTGHVEGVCVLSRKDL